MTTNIESLFDHLPRKDVKELAQLLQDALDLLSEEDYDKIVDRMSENVHDVIIDVLNEREW